MEGFMLFSNHSVENMNISPNILVKNSAILLYVLFAKIQRLITNKSLNSRNMVRTFHAIPVTFKT